MQGFFALGSATASPTPTVKPAPPEPGQMRGCPLPGRWAIAAWEGADTEADAALDTCGVWQADVAYSLYPETGGWAGWFRDRRELSTLHMMPSWGAAVVRSVMVTSDLIAFQSDRDGDDEIYVMNADGTAETRITHNPARDISPAWSPDGTKIAFTSQRDGNDEIYVMNADGTGQTRLTNNAAGDYDPAWSPDGTKIAFQSYRDSNGEIYVMNANGTVQANATLNDAADDSHPAWSTDGTKIAFTSHRDVYRAIYVMTATGTGQTRLTNNPAGESHPTWSPDGTKIAFASYRDGNTDIYVMNADGTGNTTRLTTNDDVDTEPAWRP